MWNMKMRIAVTFKLYRPSHPPFLLPFLRFFFLFLFIHLLSPFHLLFFSFFLILVSLFFGRGEWAWINLWLTKRVDSWGSKSLRSQEFGKKGWGKVILLGIIEGCFVKKGEVTMILTLCTSHPIPETSIKRFLRWASRAERVKKILQEIENDQKTNGKKERKGLLNNRFAP